MKNQITIYRVDKTGSVEIIKTIKKEKKEPECKIIVPFKKNKK